MRRHRFGAQDLGAEARAELDKLRRQLAELVGKTNERNNYVNSIFASIDEGLLLVDTGNRIVMFNPKAASLLGIGPEVFFEGGVETAGPELSAALGACASVSASRAAERRELTTAGGLILDVSIVPVADKYKSEAGYGSLAIVRDVTEVRKLENLRKDFVATVSHEFRTPLTLISGFVEMLQTRDDVDQGDRRRAFEIVGIETERLKRLVSELLTLSEIEKSLPGGADEPIDVDAVLAEAARSLEGLAAAKRLTLDVAPRAGACGLRGNADWLYLAVRNLVENAVKYTPEGGSIHASAISEGGSVIVEVSDTGIGIESAELDRIFDRFYRVEKSRGSGAGGSGLGLALVKDIAAIFGGTVEVKSHPGKGSTFTLRLGSKEGNGNG